MQRARETCRRLRGAGTDPEETIARYWLTAGLLATTLLAIFAGAQALGFGFATDPSAAFGGVGAAAAATGVGLLVADVLLPVPSSAVMIAHGALFGVAWGTLLSLLGSVGAAAVAFALGRAGGPWLLRLTTPAERARADRLLARWGALAIVATRPVPILAETVAILAGAAPVTWGRLVLASVTGALPPALLYALAGATAISWGGGAVLFLAILLVSGAFWAVSVRRGRPQPHAHH